MQYNVSKNKFQLLSQGLLHLCSKNTKNYISDFIIDIDTFRDRNERGIIPKFYIMISRENGVEMGDFKSDRIKYYLEDRGEDYKYYLISMLKLNALKEDDLFNFWNLIEEENDNVCVKEVDKNFLIEFMKSEEK